MLDSLDPPDDISARLIAELEAGAELVAVGGFTLDVEAARDKLRTHRLADPQAFVLLLVEAAHLFASCDRVEVTIAANMMRVVLHGVELDDEELRGALDAAGMTREGLAPAAATRLAARQALAVAIVAAGQLELRHARLRSSGADLQIELGPGGGIRFAPDRIRGEPRLSLEIQERVVAPWRAQNLAAHRRELLRARARYASVELVVDDDPINEGFVLREVAKPYALRRSDGEFLAVIGWSQARPRATLLLVANGVLLEKLGDAQLPGSFVALVDVSDLPRDLGMTKLLRQDAYSKRINEVREAARWLPPPRWTAPRHMTQRFGPRGFSLVMAMTGSLFCLMAVFALFAGSSLGWPLTALTTVVGLAIGLPQFLPLRGELRQHRTARRGALGVATIVAAKTLTTGWFERQFELECTVHLPGQEPFAARFNARMATSAPSPQPGTQVHVRVALDDNSSVCLAAPPKAKAEAKALGEGS